MVLEDRDFNLVAFAAHADEVDPVRQRTILQRRSSPEVQDWFEAFGIAGSERPVRTPADPARGIVARACLPARWNGVTYGYLWALDEHHRLDDALLERMMRQAARAGTLMAQRARIRQSLDGQVRDLLIGDRDVAEAAAEEIDGLGALGRDATVVAVVLDLDAPGTRRRSTSGGYRARSSPLPPPRTWSCSSRPRWTPATSPATPGCSSPNASTPGCTTPWSWASGPPARIWR